MIEVIRTREGRAVAVFCDACGKRIDNGRKAVVVAGPGERAMFAHKGTCHRSLDERSPLTAAAGFIEFNDALSQVAANSGERPA